MATIKEDYVSFEVAKLLKEKGFNEQCRAAYTNYGKLFTTQIQQYVTNVICSKGTLWDCTAPTHQMAMKWLRERGIYITSVYGDYPSLNKVFWTPQIDSIEGFDLPNSFYKEYEEYEQAVEAALKYSLENLI